MGHSCSHTSPSKRETEGIRRQKRGGPVMVEAQIGVTGPGAKECWATRSWKTEGMDSPLELPDGAQSCPHLAFSFSPVKLISDLETPECERTHFCCFKAPSLQRHVTPAQGNQPSLNCWLLAVIRGSCLPTCALGLLASEPTPHMPLLSCPLSSPLSSDPSPAPTLFSPPFYSSLSALPVPRSSIPISSA